MKLLQIRFMIIVLEFIGRVSYMKKLGLTKDAESLADELKSLTEDETSIL